MTIQEARQRMKKNGLKMTDKREVLLNVFVNNDRYLAAKDVQNLLEQTFPSISQDTIYRNLSVLTDLNILESTDLEGEKLYKLSCNFNDHHHHFICTDCGAITPLDLCPMDILKNQLPGCQVSEHRFEVFGNCQKCVRKK